MSTLDRRLRFALLKDDTVVDRPALPVHADSNGDPSVLLRQVLRERQARLVPVFFFLSYVCFMQHKSCPLSDAIGAGVTVAGLKEHKTNMNYVFFRPKTDHFPGGQIPTLSGNIAARSQATERGLSRFSRVAAMFQDGIPLKYHV